MLNNDGMYIWEKIPPRPSSPQPYVMMEMWREKLTNQVRQILSDDQLHQKYTFIVWRARLALDKIDDDIQRDPSELQYYIQRVFPFYHDQMAHILKQKS